MAGQPGNAPKVGLWIVRLPRVTGAVALAAGVSFAGALAAHATPTPTPTPTPGDAASGITPLSATAAVSLEKLVDGEGANAAPGVRMRLNSMMDLTFIVTNTGAVPLADATVTDERVGAGDIHCGAARNVIASLTPKASVTCTATFPAPQAGDFYADTATVVAKAVNGSPASVTARDSAYAYTPRYLPPAATPIPTQTPIADDAPAPAPAVTAPPSTGPAKPSGSASPAPSSSERATTAAPSATPTVIAPAAPVTSLPAAGSTAAGPADVTITPTPGSGSGSGPLANTGGPSGVFLAVGSVAVGAGTILLRTASARVRGRRSR